MSITELENSVLALPENERAQLAARLLTSLPSVLDDDDGGIAEAQRRSEDLDQNPEVTSTWEDIKSGIRKGR